MVNLGGAVYLQLLLSGPAYSGILLPGYFGLVQVNTPGEEPAFVGGCIAASLCRDAGICLSAVVCVSRCVLVFCLCVRVPVGGLVGVRVAVAVGECPRKYVS